MDTWLKIPRFIRFFIIGCINAAISFLVFVIATFLVGKEHYQICVALQWIISSVPSYFNQKFFVFHTKGNYLKEYLKCCSTWAFGWFLNFVLIEIFVRYIIGNVFISQFLSTGLVSIFTYITFKVFAFKK